MTYGLIRPLLFGVPVLLALCAAAQPPVDPGLELRFYGPATFGVNDVSPATDGRIYWGGRELVGYTSDEGTRRVVLLDLSDRTRYVESVAAHPRIAETGWLFVAYYDRNAFSRFVVERFTLNPDRESARNRGEVLFELYGNRVDLAFGPDGYLYVSVSDRSVARTAAQCEASLEGKVLRLDVDHGWQTAPYYTVPADNPYAAAGGPLPPETWADGLFEPQDLAFDRATGDLYLVDLSYPVRELNLLPAAAGGGANFGWRVRRGYACTDLPDVCQSAPCGSPLYTDPFLTHEFGEEDPCSDPVGGRVYRGPSIPELVGIYVYACDRIYLAARDGSGTWRRTATEIYAGQVTAIGEDPYGNLYVADDAIWRLVGPGSQPEDCVADDATLCLAGGRFRVRASFGGGEEPSPAHAVPITADTGYLWFFDEDNVELIVKVLDACDPFGRFWVFAGGLTNVELELEVFDSLTGQLRVYPNAAGTPFQPIQDTEAFASCF